MIRPALVAFVLLAGCSGLPDRGAQRQGVDFAPDAGGLAVVGSNQRIDFGRAPTGVVVALDRELGRHRELPLTGCPSGVIAQRAWGDLVLTFSAEGFVGWSQAGAKAGQTCA